MTQKPIVLTLFLFASALAQSVADAQSVAEAGSLAGDAKTPMPWIRWAPTIEEALQRARKEKRIVLAFVTPWDNRALEAGYKDAGRVARKTPTPTALARMRKTDPGAVKERAMITSLLCYPELADLVAHHFVPVRVNMHTWHFMFSGKGPFEDPLKQLGTSAHDAHAPALIFASPAGKRLHQIVRMGVFSPYLTYRACRAVLAKQRRLSRTPTMPKGASLEARAGTLVTQGRFAQARRALGREPATWAVTMKAKMLALEGKLDEAEATAKRAKARTLHGEILVRKRDFDGAITVLRAAGDDVRARYFLACALDRRGQREEAERIWQALATGEGPWAARSRLHVSKRGPFLREWETLSDFDVAPLIETTEQGAHARPVAAAIEYLLAQQRDGGWWIDNNYRARAPASQPAGLTLPRTALCVCALRAHRGAKNAVRADRLEQAITSGSALVTKWRPTSQVWHLTYALHFELVFQPERKGAAKAAGVRRITALLKQVSAIEHEGGWTYTRPPRAHTFNTAPLLILFTEALALGFPVDAAMRQRAADFLEANRLGKRSIFHYGTAMEHMTPKGKLTGEASTAMRSPLCELALHLSAEQGRTKRLEAALQLFFKHLDGARSTAKIYESYVDPTVLQDSYRYYFGAWYAARAINRLPRTKRDAYAKRLRTRLLAHQELDGSFVDSQMVGKSTSTALALLALAELEKRPN